MFSRFLSTRRTSWASGTIILRQPLAAGYTDVSQKWSLALPLFYFHIISENTFLDDEGTRFESEQAAMTHARELAAELVRTTGVLRGAIVVENEDAGRMFEVPLSSWNN